MTPTTRQKGDPVWAWQNGWKAATVVISLIGDHSRQTLVRFDNGVTAPAARSKVRPRDPRLKGADQPGARQWPPALALGPIAGTLRRWIFALMPPVSRASSNLGSKVCRNG
jgi:hypothetical protein